MHILQPYCINRSVCLWEYIFLSVYVWRQWVCGTAGVCAPFLHVYKRQSVVTSHFVFLLLDTFISLEFPTVVHILHFQLIIILK